jgi:hypothetical protein
MTTATKAGKARWPKITKMVVGDDPRFDERAACRLGASRLFDAKEPDEPVADYRRRADRARAVCAACPVAAGCLQFGIDNDLSGLMGGEELRKGVIKPARARCA